MSEADELEEQVASLAFDGFVAGLVDDWQPCGVVRVEHRRPSLTIAIEYSLPIILQEASDGTGRSTTSRWGLLDKVGLQAHLSQSTTVAGPLAARNPGAIGRQKKGLATATYISAGDESR